MNETLFSNVVTQWETVCEGFSSLRFTAVGGTPATWLPPHSGVLLQKSDCDETRYMWVLNCFFFHGRLRLLSISVIFRRLKAQKREHEWIALSQSETCLDIGLTKLSRFFPHCSVPRCLKLTSLPFLSWAPQNSKSCHVSHQKTLIKTWLAQQQTPRPGTWLKVRPAIINHNTYQQTKLVLGSQAA